MNITSKRTQTIIDYLVEKHWLEYCSEYGETGYSDPETGILFADWNDIPNITQEYLESAGYNLEWSDEWLIDHDNDKAYRISPDSYGWQPLTRYDANCGILTPDSNIDEWIAYAELTDYAQPINILPSFIDLSETDYERVECDYENGFHVGQNDDPKTLAKHFLGLLDVESIVFKIDSTGQFDINFSVWVIKL